MTALERLVQRSAVRGRPAAEECDMCGEPVPHEHGGGHAHVLDERRGGLLCVCRACRLLFERDESGRDGEGREHFRLVPKRRVRLHDVPVDDLGVPVGLAFFVRHADGTVTAHYPSPAGATRCDVDARDWDAAAERCEPLRSIVPEVEALLVHTGMRVEREQRWLLPVDDCYRLVAIVRTTWKGLSGGAEVWPEIERFFAELTEKGVG